MLLKRILKTSEKKEFVRILREFMDDIEYEKLSLIFSDDKKETLRIMVSSTRHVLEGPFCFNLTAVEKEEAKALFQEIDADKAFASELLSSTQNGESKFGIIV